MAFPFYGTIDWMVTHIIDQTIVLCTWSKVEFMVISALHQLAEAVQRPGIASLYLPVDDSAILLEYLRQGVAFICVQKQLGRVILVACGAGRSRSVGFAAAALKEEEKISLRFR